MFSTAPALALDNGPSCFPMLVVILSEKPLSPSVDWSSDDPEEPKIVHVTVTKASPSIWLTVIKDSSKLVASAIALMRLVFIELNVSVANRRSTPLVPTLKKVRPIIGSFAVTADLSVRD